LLFTVTYLLLAQRGKSKDKSFRLATVASKLRYNQISNYLDLFSSYFKGRIQNLKSMRQNPFRWSTVRNLPVVVRLCIVSRHSYDCILRNFKNSSRPHTFWLTQNSGFQILLEIIEYYIFVNITYTKLLRRINSLMKI
jgi:hypothetical protein